MKEMSFKSGTNRGEEERREGRAIDKTATHEQDLARRQSPHVGFLIR